MTVFLKDEVEIGKEKNCKGSFKILYYSLRRLPFGASEREHFVIILNGGKHFITRVILDFL